MPPADDSKMWKFPHVEKNTLPHYCQRMTGDPHAPLSAREREIVDILYRLGTGTAEDVKAAMDAPPSNATVRSTLRVLEEKGWVRHSRDGARFVYVPTAQAGEVQRRMLRHVVQTFFRGSAARAAASLLGDVRKLDRRERARIRKVLEELEEEDQ